MRKNEQRCHEPLTDPDDNRAIYLREPLVEKQVRRAKIERVKSKRGNTDQRFQQRIDLQRIREPFGIAPGHVSTQRQPAHEQHEYQRLSIGRMPEK